MKLCWARTVLKRAMSSTAMATWLASVKSRSRSSEP